MLNGGSMIWGFCVYFVYMIPLETDVLRKHRFRKVIKLSFDRRNGLLNCFVGLLKLNYVLKLH